VESKTYVEIEQELQVEFSEPEKKALETIYSRVSANVKASNDIETILGEMLHILCKEECRALRREIHPAHIIIKDCIRPGCQQLNVHNHSDWGLDLGYRIRNTGSKTTSLRDEKELAAIRESIEEIDADLLKYKRGFQRNEKMKLIKGVRQRIVDNTSRRRRVQCHRMYHEENLRAVVDFILSKVDTTAVCVSTASVAPGITGTTDITGTTPHAGSTAVSTGRRVSTASVAPGTTPHATSDGRNSTGRRSMSSVRFEPDGPRDVIQGSSEQDFDDLGPDYSAGDEEDYYDSTLRVTVVESSAFRTRTSGALANAENVVRRHEYTESSPEVVATLVFDDSVHLPLDANLATIRKTLKQKTFKPEGKSLFPIEIVSPSQEEIRQCMEALTLSPPNASNSDEKVASGFIVIGDITPVLRPERGGKPSRYAICIFPGHLRRHTEFAVQFLHPPDVVRKQMNNLQKSANLMEGILRVRDDSTTRDEEGETRSEMKECVPKMKFVLYDDIIYMQKTLTDFKRLTNVDEEKGGLMSSAWRKDLEVGVVSEAYQDKVQQQQQQRQPKLYAVRLNNATSHKLGADRQSYKDSGIRIHVSGQCLSRSGRRRESDKCINLIDQQVPNTALHDEGSQLHREKRLVENVSHLGASRVPLSKLDAVLDAIKGRNLLNQAQMDAIIALLFCDPSWSLEELSPHPVTLSDATLDIDQLMGTGQIDTDAFRAYLSQKGIEITPDTSLEDPVIFSFLAHFQAILIDEVLVPPRNETESEEQRQTIFFNFFKSQKLRFSKDSVSKKFPMWASLSGGSKPAIRDCFHVPAQQADTTVFHVAIRLVGETLPRDTGRSCDWMFLIFP
jgi:hypothetical protein